MKKVTDRQKVAVALVFVAFAVGGAIVKIALSLLTFLIVFGHFIWR